MLFYWLSYKALTHPVIFGLHPVVPGNIPETKDGIDDNEKYSRSTVEPERLDLIFQNIQKILNEEHLFLKSDLTLTELANRINVPRHQVSQAINSRYKGNFFDLINDYRVSTFKESAADPSRKHMSLLGIAQESGFNSKASFYAIFKKKSGMTPSEYLASKSKPAK